jgi:hypothetical protein
MPPSNSTIGIMTAVAVSIAATIFIVTRPGRNEERPATPPPDSPADTRDERETGPKADEILTKLKTGMLRGDVEVLLGKPANVDSVRGADGRLSYLATFSRDRVRPPLVLEFDATRPGHPLLLVAQPM